MFGINPEYVVVTGMSPVSSTRRSASKKAVLEGKVTTLQKLHELQIEQLRPKQRKAELQLQANIAVTETKRQNHEEAEAQEAQKSEISQAMM